MKETGKEKKRVRERETSEITNVGRKREKGKGDRE